MRPASKIHLVARLQPQTNRPKMRIQSAAWINHSVHIAGAEIRNLARDATKRRRARIYEKLVEPALQHHEWPHAPVSQLHLRPEQSMQNINVRVLNEDRSARSGRQLAESLVKVVRHFPFQLHMRK